MKKLLLLVLFVTFSFGSMCSIYTDTFYGLQKKKVFQTKLDRDQKRTDESLIISLGSIIQYCPVDISDEYQLILIKIGVIKK